VISLTTILQSLLSGLVEGVHYALYCLGLAFVFGVMRIINLAHGEFLVLGGFVAYWLLVLCGINPLLAMPAAAAVAGGAAFLSYRIFIERIRTTSELNTLILTFGLSVFLANLFIECWTADLRNLSVEGLEQSVSFRGLYMSVGEIVTLAVSLAVVFCLHLFLTRSKKGLAIRVTAIDRDAAALAGINVSRVDLLAFSIGGILAGLSGPLLGTLTHISPGAGVAITIKAFILTVLAGVGSLLGLVVAGIILGVGEAMTVTFTNASYRELFGFILFLVILLVRPKGLFGKEL
jgi:branched-chain amino acid transport system permease protein